ncbi:hypothetical protein ACFOU2_08175 [Bacillus songklensis]|uniref:Uncharacterized protein n=1 Tax=Bacillus songklensis TaxID=1069116 RepID=A0ABV8AZS7_9BACI
MHRSTNNPQMGLSLIDAEGHYVFTDGAKTILLKSRMIGVLEMVCLHRFIEQVLSVSFITPKTSAPTTTKYEYRGHIIVKYRSSSFLDD